jgi:hypothetical protein
MMRLGETRKLGSHVDQHQQDFKLKEQGICIFNFKDERCYPFNSRDEWVWLRIVIPKIEEW